MANKKAVPSTKLPQYDHLVAVIREARISQGISQLELARLLGQSEAYIRKIENSERRIDVLEFLLLAEALKVDARELFGAFAERVRGS